MARQQRHLARDHAEFWPAAAAGDDYGDVLQPARVYGPSGPVEGGPLFFNGPGDLTRYMAVPWQTDTSSCRSGYAADYDPYLPTFWPQRVPNQVLTQASYDKIRSSPRAEVSTVPSPVDPLSAP